MAIREIWTYPAEILRKQAQPVENIDDELQRLIDDMAETMYAAPGVGLAAVQVGVDKNMLIYDISEERDRGKLTVLINPKLVTAEGEIISEAEGCLSIPDFRADVKRASKVLVEGFDREGKPLRYEADDYHAIVLQHEIDHLNGILFIDRISALKRELYKRRIKKMMKTQ